MVAAAILSARGWRPVLIHSSSCDEVCRGSRFRANWSRGRASRASIVALASAKLSSSERGVRGAGFWKRCARMRCVFAAALSLCAATLISSPSSPLRFPLITSRLPLISASMACIRCWNATCACAASARRSCSQAANKRSTLPLAPPGIAARRVRDGSTSCSQHSPLGLEVFFIKCQIERTGILPPPLVNGLGFVGSASLRGVLAALGCSGARF